MAEAKEVSETKQELSLVCSAETVYSDPGDDVVLSCHLEPAISAVSMEIKWRNRVDLVCHYKDRRMTEIRGYEGQVSLSLQDLPSGKVSLTIRDVRTSQKGLYICEVIHEWKTLKQYIFLHVSSDFSLVVPSRTVPAYPGADVILPIHLSPETSAVFMKIRWYRDTELIYQYMTGEEIISFDYENRVGLSIQELGRGNLSLTLRNVQQSDSGDYICKVFHDGCLQTEIIHLQVREEDETTVDRHLREEERRQRLFSHFLGFTPWRTNIEGLPPLNTSTLRQPLMPRPFPGYFGFTPRRANSVEGLPPLMADTSTPRDQLMPSPFLDTFGFTPRRANSMEGLPPLMESGSSSQNTRQTREENTGTELFPEPARGMTQAQENPGATMQRNEKSRQERIAGEQVRLSPAMSSQGLLREIIQESIFLHTRSSRQAQASLRATMQSAQGGRLTNTFTVQRCHSPAVQSQVQEQARTSQSVTSQENTGGKCQIL